MTSTASGSPNPAAAEVCLALVTRDQAGLLRVFLDNWLRHGADLVPLLVVDDASSDATGDLLAGLPRDVPASVHRIAHVSIAHARNQALRRCATPWVAFSDTDCLLGRDYFEALAGVPRRFPGATAVEGAVRPPPGRRPPFTHAVVNLQGGFYATANMVFRREAVLSLGGFDEEAFGNYREDTDLAMTLLERTGPIPFHPGLAVTHPFIPRRVLPELRRAFGAQARIIAAEIRLFEKHPEGYGRVRRRRDARATLTAWCARHSAFLLKECLRYLFATPGLSARERAAGLRLSAQAMVVALWEHVCIAALCMVRWRRIARLVSP